MSMLACRHRPPAPPLLGTPPGCRGMGHSSTLSRAMRARARPRAVHAHACMHAPTLPYGTPAVHACITQPMPGPLMAHARARTSNACTRAPTAAHQCPPSPFPCGSQLAWWTIGFYSTVAWLVTGGKKEEAPKA